MDAYDWLRILTGMRLQKTANIRSSRDSESLQTITGEMVPGSYESVVLISMLLKDCLSKFFELASAQTLQQSLGGPPRYEGARAKVGDDCYWGTGKYQSCL